MDDKKYWIGFNLIKGIDAVRLQGLIAYFGDLESAWKAESASLHEAGLGSKLIEGVIQAKENVDLDQVWDKIEKQGIKILTWQDEAYPARLKEIDQPPPVLYIRGEYLHVDEIRNQGGLPIEKVSATLALMELKGPVRQVGGMNYVAIREEQAEYKGNKWKCLNIIMQLLWLAEVAHVSGQSQEKKNPNSCCLCLGTRHCSKVQ